MSFLNERDMEFEFFLRAEKGYGSVVAIAQALFDLCWFVKLKGSLPWTAEAFHPAFEEKIYKMAKQIHGFSRPVRVADSVDFINAFIEGREVKCRNRSTVEDFLKELLEQGKSGR